MARSRIRTVIFGTCALATLALVCILFTSSLITEQRRELDRKIVQDAIERQETRRRTVEQARAHLPQDSGLAKDWDFGNAMTVWDSDDVQALFELGRRLYGRGENLSADEKEKLARFVMYSPEVRELLKAIEHGLCQITFDPSKGQWQFNSQVRALKAMTHLLAVRAFLLAQDGRADEAMGTVLGIYELVDSLTDLHNVEIQFRRSEMLMYAGYALYDAINPEEISDESRAALLAYLEKQSSPKPIVNALQLHEALVRQEVIGKVPAPMVSWYLAGYDKGITRMIQCLDKPEQQIRAEREDILDDVPFYAVQSYWRLQNVIHVLDGRINTQRHVARMRSFLGIQ